MSTTRATAAAILGSVTMAATTVSSTFAAANRGVGMLNTIVNDAADNQLLRSKANRLAFTDNLIRQMARQEAEADLAEVEFMKKSAEHLEAYKKNFTKYSELLKPTQGAE